MVDNGLNIMKKQQQRKLMNLIKLAANFEDHCTVEPNRHIKYKRHETVKPIDEQKDADEYDTACYKSGKRKWKASYKKTAGMHLSVSFLSCNSPCLLCTGTFRFISNG